MNNRKLLPRVVIITALAFLLQGCSSEQSTQQWIGFEGFEEEGLSWHSWGYQVNDGEYLPDTNWTRANDFAHSGQYSVKAGQIGDNEISALAVTLDVANNGNISFYIKVSSEAENDSLVFYIDGVEQGRWSGEVQLPVSFPVTTGTRAFKWVYEKNYSGSAGDDTVWIDDIAFPPIAEEASEWWLSFTEYLTFVEVEYALHPSPMSGLGRHPACQGDMISDWVLQRHGQAILDGAKILPRDPNAAKERFEDAASELAKFANYLNCLDFDGLRFWDRAIGGYLEDITNQSLKNPGISTDEAVKALWNPALLVVDMLQVTGESYIVDVFRTHANTFSSSLQDYPVDTYGAALLDNFGTGQLIRKTGKTALDNLVVALAEPTRLGLGLCPLASHADKAEGMWGCLIGLDSPQICDIEGLLEMLWEMNLASQMFQSTPNLIGTNGWPQTTTTGPTGEPITVRVGIRGNQLTGIAYYDEGGPSVETQIPISYFGTPITILAQEALCSGLKPKGLGASIPSDGIPYGIDKCTFSMVSQGWQQPGDRILRCFEKYETPLMTSPVEAIEYQLPVPECGRSQFYNNPDLWKRLAEALTKFGKELGKAILQNEAAKSALDLATSAAETVTEWSKKLNDYIESIPQLPPSSPAAGVGPEDAGTSTPSQPSDGGLPENEPDAEPQDRSIPPKDTTPPGGVPPSEVTPIEPGFGGCPESAAMQRAKMMFDCLFDDGPQPVGIGGPPDPWINPEPDGGQAGLPYACNEIDGRVFFSSTGGGVTDPSPLDAPKRGPTILDPFRPRIEWWFTPKEQPNTFVPEVFVPNVAIQPSN